MFRIRADDPKVQDRFRDTVEEAAYAALEGKEMSPRSTFVISKHTGRLTSDRGDVWREDGLPMAHTDSQVLRRLRAEFARVMG